MVANRLCHDCETLGMRVAATRITPGRTPLCEEHWRKRLGIPLPAAKEKEMPQRKNIDWDAVQADRNAGIPVSELVKKYGISNPVIYVKTKPPGNGKQRAGGASSPKISKARRSLQRLRGSAGYRGLPRGFAKTT
jgi:hypothetical protein